NFENAKKGDELASVESEFELTDVEGTSLIQSRVLRNKTQKKIVKFQRSSSPVRPVSSNVANSKITAYEEPNSDVHIDGGNIFQAEELGIASLDIGSEYLTVTADHQLQTCNYHGDTGGQRNVDVASRLDLLLGEFQNFRQEFRTSLRFQHSTQATFPTEADVDKCVQKWFGGAGDRNGGRAERKKQQDKLKAVA
ncbi:unnamed protein product, partial [Allacma fusca]